MLRQLTNVFGGPALLPGEGKDEHTAIHNGVFDALQPQDYIELLWAVDIADAEIDVQRMKRLRTKYLQGRRRQNLIQKVAEISAADPLGNLSKHKVAEQFVSDTLSKLGGEAQIYDKLKSSGHDPAIIMANAVYESVAEIESFDRLIDQAITRRDHLVRQFHDYRERRKGRRTVPGLIDSGRGRCAARVEAAAPMESKKRPSSSERKREANRANAARSTGPRTPQGKAVSRHNARRHGLAAPIGDDPAEAERIEAIALLLMKGASNSAAFGYARLVAEATLELARIGAVRFSIIATALQESADWTEARRKHIEATRAEPPVNGHPHPASAASSSLLPAVRRFLEQSSTPTNLLPLSAPEAGFSPVPEDPSEPLRDTAEELQRLHRYERRALSRRKKALRELQWHLFPGESEAAKRLR